MHHRYPFIVTKNNFVIQSLPDNMTPLALLGWNHKRIDKILKGFWHHGIVSGRLWRNGNARGSEWKKPTLRSIPIGHKVGVPQTGRGRWASSTSGAKNISTYCRNNDDAISMSDTRWGCQKIKLTQDLAWASSKTQKSIFFISGLPEIVYQGTHISGRYKVQFVTCWWMIAKWSNNNPMVPESFEDFVSPLYTSKLSNVGDWQRVILTGDFYQKTVIKSNCHIIRCHIIWEALYLSLLWRNSGFPRKDANQAELLCRSNRFGEIHIFPHNNLGTEAPSGETWISQKLWQV